MKKKHLLIIISIIIFLTGCTQQSSRITEDFNHNWKFHLGDESGAQSPDFNDSEWRELSVPHDWSIEEAYQKKGTSASTGFVPGGIGWYRKSFKMNSKDQGKQISIMFDGIYNNSTVWVNGYELGFRPYGYATFSYDLSKHLKYDGSQNIIAVKVDRTTYADSRWYTGSGIYRKIRLIKKSPLHIAQWGVQITTPEISEEKALVNIKTKLENSGENKSESITLKYKVLSPENTVVKESVKVASGNLSGNEVELTIPSPLLWDVENPNLYSLKVELYENDKLVDETTKRFGIRYFNFDANKGFSLNGKPMKIKGVNLHHDAGAVGSAVPKAIWEYRVEKLKSIGTNAIRMSHNPHSKELMEVCDEMGILVMNEAFDEWSLPKAKSLHFSGDGKAPKEAARAYTEHFNEWAERDLKDLIRRDFNHPSVIMWSIGNEIEWTFPYYAQTYSKVNGADKKYYKHTPLYDSLTIKTAFDKISGGADLLEETSRQLATWVKEEDTTRPVMAGSVHPSVGLASGYGATLDVYGFNYRAVEYDAAHKTYPNLKIIGSENWGSYSEWKNCIERDFVAGIFVWTGFAYLGEAGPWPRKGLEISFFDYAGFKTPRGHFYECLWKNDPKVYMVTTPVKESEYAYSETDGWQFDIQLYQPPFWPELRLWEWYKNYPKWNYNSGEEIIVQTYTNCEEAELFLNGKSLGKQKRTDFADDNIIKWLVPYTDGELKVVGLNNGEKITEYYLNTPDEPAEIFLSSAKTNIKADGYDVAIITAELKDKNGNTITDADCEIEFELSGPGKNIGVDNGWERNIEKHKSNFVVTHNGKAILLVQSQQTTGQISVTAKSGKLQSNKLTIVTE